MAEIKKISTPKTKEEKNTDFLMFGLRRFIIHSVSKNKVEILCEKPKSKRLLD